MAHRFDADELFGADYLHFYQGALGEDRSDEDTDLAIGFAHLAAGMHVLDAPCGHGRMAVRMAERGLHVTGVDRAEHFLDHAREDAARRGVEVDLRQGDLRSLPVDGPFDAVVCWFTSFGYFDDDENLQVLREFRRVLRPGGHLVLETMSHDGYVRRFTEAPEAIVVEVGDDLMVDRNSFDATTGSIVGHRVTIRDGVRREARFSIRLPTVPEWYRFLADAGFASVEVTDRQGAPVEVSTWRVVVTAVA